MQHITVQSGHPHTALVIIDVQVGLVNLMPDDILSAVLPNIATLLAKARAAEMPVIYIQHDGSKSHPLEPNTKGWEIHPSIQPNDGELVIRKRESDSFFETILYRELEGRAIRHLIIAGGMTECCVDTTCRRATSLGYDITLASDAHLTKNNGILTAWNIIAHHNLVLDGFGAGGHVIKVRPTNQIVF